MKIGLRGGHSRNCIGAIGLVNEYEQMQKFYKAVSEMLIKYGYTVIDCNSNGSNASQELSEGVTKANNNNVDLFISLHMNAYNGTANGAETVVYSEKSKAYAIAKRIVNNYALLGFNNRGVKVNRGLYELRNSKAPAIISEICFCDSQKDIDIYNQYSWEQLASCLCNAIDGNIPYKSSEESNKKGYVITDYLKGGYKGDGAFEDVDIEYYHNIIGKDIKIYAKGDQRGIWFTTENLPMSKCEEIKNKLGQLFYNIG